MVYLTVTWIGMTLLSLQVSRSSLPFSSLTRLEEIRSYMYETLMYLVGIHAQVTNAAEPLLDRTLSTVVVDLAEEALRCFRQVKRFGMGGMLRVRSHTSLPSHSIKPSYPSRQHLRSNLCIRPLGAMLRLPRRRRCRTCTIKSPRHTLVDLEMKIYKTISTVLRKHWPIHDGRRVLNSCASGKQSYPVAARRTLGIIKRGPKVQRK